MHADAQTPDDGSAPFDSSLLQQIYCQMDGQTADIRVNSVYSHSTFGGAGV